MLSKSKKMLKLLENELFQELIIDDFIKGGIQENVLAQSLKSENTIDELKARQILHSYLFGIIESTSNEE
jgi:hypothetical protein